MPGGDRTGPAGLGPMTGRRVGFCAGYALPGYANFAPGWACRGGGRGWRNRYYETVLTGWRRAGTAWAGVWAPSTPPMNQELELATLKTQAENLTRTLDGIRRQIETLEAQSHKDAQ